MSTVNKIKRAHLQGQGRDICFVHVNFGACAAGNIISSYQTYLSS